MPHTGGDIIERKLTMYMSMLQMEMVVFRSWEHYLSTMVLEERLTEAEWGHVRLCGL